MQLFWCSIFKSYFSLFLETFQTEVEIFLYEHRYGNALFAFALARFLSFGNHGNRSAEWISCGKLP